MLVGIVLLGSAAGTYRISQIVAAPPSGTAVVVAVGLLLAGAVTKSALVPFHFWLPAAMAAPTPVSAYLHAAAMVKAGVYLVARFAPAFADLTVWQVTVLSLGAGTLLVGGYRALRQYDLKLVLAFGTVSQLGLLVMLVGYGTREAALAGAAMLGAHAMFKSALFLSVGVVDAATGTRDLRRLHGVGRALPMTALAAGLATASMIGVPPFAGYVGKEAAIEALRHDASWPGRVVLAALVVGSVLTVAYGLRFWWGAFAAKRVLPGEEAAPGVGPAAAADAPTADVLRRPSVLLVGPALVLAVLGLVTGLAPGPRRAPAEPVRGPGARRARPPGALGGRHRGAVHGGHPRRRRAAVLAAVRRRGLAGAPAVAAGRGPGLPAVDAPARRARRRRHRCHPARFAAAVPGHGHGRHGARGGLDAAARRPGCPAPATCGCGTPPSRRSPAPWPWSRRSWPPGPGAGSRRCCWPGSAGSASRPCSWCTGRPTSG